MVRSAWQHRCVVDRGAGLPRYGGEDGRSAGALERLSGIGSELAQTVYACPDRFPRRTCAVRDGTADLARRVFDRDGSLARLSAGILAGTVPRPSSGSAQLVLNLILLK